MGNLFLGFPVSRAKIADMIAADAPPILHHTQHENGGTDEIDATGLTGAGGGSPPLGSPFSYVGTFESLDGYNQSVSGSATITLDQYGVSLKTGTTANSVATLKKGNTNPNTFLDFDREIALLLEVDISSPTDNLGTIKLICGQKDAGLHIGFTVVNGVLKGSVGNDVSETTVNLETLGAGAYFQRRALRAILTPGVKCEFYKGETLLGSITTGLPSGLTAGTDFIYLYNKNTGTAVNKTLAITGYNIQITL